MGLILKRQMRTPAALASLALLASWLTAQPATAPANPTASAEETPFAAIPADIADLSRITGLKPLKKVQYDTMNREQLKRYLDRKVKEELKPEEIRIQELTLKRLGLVPQDFQLAKAMIDLMAEQAEAFYDYHQKKLFLVQGTEDADPIQEAALLHELAHALADQHFQLDKFIKRGKTDDSSLARAAVMEGQATWIMYEWMANKAGQSMLKNAALANMMSARSGSVTAQYPVLGGAPLYLRASLLFPYTEGLRFQQAVLDKMGQAGFSEVFKSAPQNSQQILHPEKYFAGVKSVEPKLPLVARPERYKELATATMGEFDYSVLLQQYAGQEEADAVPVHWRGGLVRLLEDKKDKHVLLLYASEWETPEIARRLFDDYKKILEGKWKTLEYIRQTDNLLEGTGDDGAFRLRLDGTRILGIEGMKEPAEADTQS